MSVLVQGSAPAKPTRIAHRLAPSWSPIVGVERRAYRGRYTVMRSWLEIAKQGPLVSVTRAHEPRCLRLWPTAGKALLVPAALAAALALTAGGSARAADDGVNPLARFLARNRPVICRDQTYGLCAGARCFVFNDVAYCTCDVKKGNSISSPFNYDGGNVCSVNAEGANNGYMVSTFSLPPSLVAPSGSVPPPGSQALYICPRTSSAAYAKCDGGICFTSTQGQSFPGLGQLGSDQIVCSCPVERANPIQGLEIIGPYPCQERFFRNCDGTVANNDNGSTLYDGTSIGSTVTGIYLLYGSVPALNTCR